MSFQDVLLMLAMVSILAFSLVGVYYWVKMEKAIGMLFWTVAMIIVSLGCLIINISDILTLFFTLIMLGCLISFLVYSQKNK